MEVTTNRSFTEYVQSKLLACEHARADLEREFIALEISWLPRNQDIEKLQDEATAAHKALKTCIKEQNNMAKLCDELEIRTQNLEDSCDDLEMLNQDTKYQIEEYTTAVEDVKENNKKMSLSLRQAEEKVKELSEMNRSLSQQLSGLKILPKSREESK